MIALRSSDALHWEKIQADPVISDGAFDSLNLPLWDEARSRYVAFYRGFNNGVRHVKCAASRDFLTWPPGQWFDFGDAPAEPRVTEFVDYLPLLGLTILVELGIAMVLCRTRRPTVARDLIRGHGGDVTLETAPAGGVRARLRLPA